MIFWNEVWYSLVITKVGYLFLIKKIVKIIFEDYYVLSQDHQKTQKNQYVEFHLFVWYFFLWKTFLINVQIFRIYILQLKHYYALTINYYLIHE